MADSPGEIRFKIYSVYDSSFSHSKKYLPKIINPSLSNLPDSIILFVDTVTQIEYKRILNKYSKHYNIFNKNQERIINGHNIYVLNKTNDTLKLVADQGNLFIYGEVLYDGKWRKIHNYGNYCPIEFRYEYLPPNNYWESKIPKYGGNIKVKMRYVLERVEGEKKTIYSNVFSERIQIYQLK